MLCGDKMADSNMIIFQTLIWQHG